jgi:aminopeptidase N
MRKPFALLLLGFFATASHAESTPGIQPTGLPKDVVPKSYLIHLEPNIDTLVTDGVESIEIEVLNPTNRIVLNTLDTTIGEARVDAGGHPEQLTPELDSNQQTVSFESKNTLQPGRYTLSIRFQSRITQHPYGMFVIHCGRVGATEQILTTETRPGDTRRIFPCWDDPALPATFQLSIKTRKENAVISNMPIFVEQPLGPEQKIVVFDRSRPMPSSTVLLACGKFEWLDGGVAGVKLRIITTPGKKEFGKYAMEVTKQLVPYFNAYFGLPFPLSKLDQLALPCEQEAHMGDWGGIAYDEEVLLCDRTTSSESARERIFLTVAQKIANQWLGNLARMTSRSDLWVIDGFTSWIAKKAADHFNPQWSIWLHTSVQKEAAMILDAEEMSDPIRQSAGDQGQATNAIASQKPWLLFRMLESFSGEDPFRDAIRTFLAAHQESDTTSDDLWASLDHATGKPIKNIVSGWTEQSGFPLIKVTTQCVGGNRVISLEQLPFSFAQRGKTPMQWIVPVSIRSTAKPDEVKYALLGKLSNNFDLTGCSGVIQANAGNVGYYRVLYEPALFNELQKNVEELPESDRINLVTDTWALFESGNVPASSYFDLLEELRRDDSFAVWQSVLGADKAIGALKLVDRLEQGRPGRQAYQRYICSLLGPKLQQLGWDERTGENVETRCFRAMLIETLGIFGDRNVIDESFKRFEKYRENPSSLAPDLRPGVTTIVGRYSSQTVYHELQTLAEDTWNVEEKRMYLRALGVALDPDLARETLQYLISDKVVPSDASPTLEYLATEGEHPEIAWSFAVAHLKVMQERFGSTRQNRLLLSIATGFTENQRADDLSSFAHTSLPSAATRDTENSISEIRFRAKLKAKILPPIDEWIKAKLEGTLDNATRNP